MGRRFKSGRCYPRQLMSDDTDERLLRRLAHATRRDPWVYDRRPRAGLRRIRGLRAMAESCESFQVTRLRKARFSWARIASWADVSAQALHKKHEKAFTETAEP